MIKMTNESTYIQNRKKIKKNRNLLIYKIQLK